MKEFNQRFVHVKVYLEIHDPAKITFNSHVKHDTRLTFAAFTLSFLYSVFMLGSCSPIHCRMFIAIAGLLTIGAASYAGIGLCSMLGYPKHEIHDLILVLMLGLGIDDMFVICNDLDQSSLFKPTDQRLKEATARAGPSITLTSVTDGLCFLVGATSSIPAVSSFCIYCSVSVLFLYVGVLTIFIPVLYWDTRRVQAGRKECCGLFCCHETDSQLFCHGRLLSKNKLDFSKFKAEANNNSEANQVRQLRQGEEDQIVASIME